MKFGRLYHIIHHAEEVRDNAREELDCLTGVQGNKLQVAIYAAAAERVEGMTAEEKIRAIRDGLEQNSVRNYLENNATSLVAFGTFQEKEPKLDCILGSLLQQLIFIIACRFEGIPLPGES